MHLKDFDLTDLLQVVAKLEALHVTIFLELTIFEQLVLVLDLEGLEINLLGSIFVIRSVNRSPELDSDGIIFLGVRLIDSSLNVVDDLLLG